MSVSCPHCGAVASYGHDIGHKSGCPSTMPDWPPQGSAIGLPEGTKRHGSTGQLFEVKNGRWERVIPAPEDFAIMGTPEAAHDALLAKAREWRELRQPSIATAKEHREQDLREHNVRFELANAALLWLWHQENPAETNG